MQKKSTVACNGIAWKEAYISERGNPRIFLKLFSIPHSNLKQKLKENILWKSDIIQMDYNFKELWKINYHYHRIYIPSSSNPRNLLRSSYYLYLPYNITPVSKFNILFVLLVQKQIYAKLIQ